MWKSQKFYHFFRPKKSPSQAYDNKETLKEKKYSETAIKQIGNWGLISRIILPDLKETKGVGIAKMLGVHTKGKEQKIKFGIVSDELTFLTPSPKSITIQNFSNLLDRKTKEVKFFHYWLTWQEYLRENSSRFFHLENIR